MVKVSCEKCGKVFNKPPSKTTNRIFCSTGCYKDAVKRTEWIHPNCECSQFIDSNGRMRVWVPNHPRSYDSGYLLRNIVHWEYYNGQRVPEGYDVHHIDGNKLNDSKENLEILEHTKHAKHHNPVKWILKICKWCNKKTNYPSTRFSKNEPNRGKFCSQECYKEWRKQHGKQNK